MARPLAGSLQSRAVQRGGAREPLRRIRRRRPPARRQRRPRRHLPKADRLPRHGAERGPRGNEPAASLRRRRTDQSEHHARRLQHVAGGSTVKHAAFFGDGDHVFALTPDMILELERKTGTGIG